MSNQLGLLEQVDLRQAWTHEALDFTPWLASRENLALLQTVLDMELELEAQEQNVGPFRADILCKDVSSDQWVLIENQLETTDHSHLGQLLTYAAGLDAVTIVWIARKFTDEHRAALNWLNGVTDERIKFFGIEIELWRIGNSSLAPKFNLVSQPNDWTKAVKGAKRVIADEALTPKKRLYVEYWTGFREYIRVRNTELKPRKARPLAWMDIGIGLAEGYPFAVLSYPKPDLMIHFHFPAQWAEIHVALRNDQRAIEQEIGFPLKWVGPPSNGRFYQIQSTGGPEYDLADKERWPEYMAWHLATALKFKDCLCPRIKSLQGNALEGGAAFVDAIDVDS